MLKFVFFTLLIFVGVKRWVVRQGLVFLGVFILRLRCVGGFYISCMGYYLGMDYISYRMVLLSF